MSPKLTRREFLQAGALVATASVVSGCTVNLQTPVYLESYVKPPEEGLPGENLWYASTCRQCAAGCGVIVRTSNGRARKVEGNPLHPVNKGRLCARGQAALQELYNPDRLQNAVRQNGRGSLKFQPIYWEDALKSVGEALAQAGPGGIAFWGGDVSTDLAFIASRFFAALDAHPSVFYTLGDDLEGRSALLQASQQLFGVRSIPVYDIANADAVFSFGANFLETWLSPVSYSRGYSQMRQGQLGERGYLVQFESRCSSTAACADEWVRVNPGTEGLVALALGKLVTESAQGRQAGISGMGLYDKVNVTEIADLSGVPAEQLAHLAQALTSVSSPVAVAGGAVAAQNNAQPALAAVQALNAVLGRLGKPGGVYLPPEIDVEGFRLAPQSSFADVEKLIANMADGRIKVLLIHGANPVFDLPQSAGFAKALANVPLVVSFSSTVNDTATQADLILPDRTNLETWGYQVSSIDRQTVGGLQPAVQPLYDTRSTVDVLLALAQAAGGKLAQALPWRNQVEFLKDITEGLRDPETSPEVFWSVWRQRGGWWTDRPEWKTPSIGPGLRTALTPAAPTFQGDQNEFPLNLYPYPSITLFDGRGADKSWLEETPDPMSTVSWQTWIELHPQTAALLGLSDGDIVKVVSPAGEIEAITYVYPGVGEQVVGMPIGRGHYQYGRYANGIGTNPAQLLVPGNADGTATLAPAATRVRLVRTGQRRSLARLDSVEGIEYVRKQSL